MDIEDLMERFPHIAEEIFECLDNKSLGKCREVVKSWQEFIDQRNLPWKRIVKVEKYFEDGSKFLHVAVKTGQVKMFKKLIEDEEDKNPRNAKRKTPFNIAVENGYFEITEFLIQNSTKINLYLDLLEWESLEAAYNGGHLNLVELLIKSSNEVSKHEYFTWTAKFGYFEMAKFLIQNSAKFNIDLNYNTGCRMTVFHVACQEDQIEIVELLIKNSIDYDIHLNAEDSS